MPPAARRVLNVLLPGCGLVLRGRLTAGMPLLVAALALATLALIALLAPLPGFDAGFALWALAGYLGFGAVAAAALWAWERGAQLDPAAVRAIHHRLASAYLRGDHPAARAAADELVRAAAREPGAWSLLALTAGAAGDAATAARARRRAQSLEADSLQ
jgi:hypothetical protein